MNKFVIISIGWVVIAMELDVNIVEVGDVDMSILQVDV